MRGRFLALFSAMLAMTACATSSEPRLAKLSAMPDEAQMTAVKSAVKSAMKRDDLTMDPGRLMDTSVLIVRPRAVEGLTDRVPGTPTRFMLMTDGSLCWLQEERGEMRVDLPDGLSCV